MPELLTSNLASHWDRSRWEPGERRLHWYVLPGASVHATVGRAQEAIMREELTAIPSEWLHCTVIPLRNSNGIGADELASLLQRGRQAVAEVDAFETPKGRAQFWGNAIVYDLSPCPELSTIHHALTDVSAEFLPGPRPDHFTPHITFSYAHAAGDSTATINAIADPSLDLPTFRIESVWLLDVAREPGPERGWYSWNVIGEAPLRTTADL